MELRHLRYAIAAAEHGSFRKAAKALGIHESAVSRRIRDIEDQMGAALFIRSPSGVTLTYAGQRFVSRAKKAVSQVGYAIKDVSVVGRGDEGVVRIGIFSSLASGFLAELLHAYRAVHPRVRLDVIEGGPAEQIPAIQQHRIDVAFLTGQPIAAGCEMAQLWTERVFVALPKWHSLAVRKEISWHDLREHRFIVSEVEPGREIYDYLVKHLADLGHHPLVERHSVYRDTLMQLVAIGRGLTVTSEATVATGFPGVVYRQLAGEVLPFCAIWSPGNDNPAFRRLLSLANSMSVTTE
ncbi:MAG: LysR family transcriptional regulator [Hyphomicrobium denitrificans]|nr:LysR family transcriptional regulator [Hyphomicrobium denitrificans]